MSQPDADPYEGYEVLKDWRDSNFGTVARELAGAYDDLLSRHVVTTPSMALDIGFGNGEMLVCLRERGVLNVHGVELNRVLRERALSAGFSSFASLSDWRENNPELRPDLVTAMHVFEHIPFSELRGMLSDIAETLSANGLLIGAFPNGDSPFAATAFHSDPTHVTWLTRQKCELLSRTSGLRLMAYGAFPSPANFSAKATVRAVSRIRGVAERLISKMLASVYYGRQQIEMAPVAVAIWSR